LNKKCVLLTFCILTSIVLFIISCGSGTTTTTTSQTTAVGPTTTTTAPTTKTSTPASDKPKYGGTLNLFQAGDVLGFDEGFQAAFFVTTNHLTHDEPLTGDWSKGPAGTNEYSWFSNANYSWASKAGSVAESYELPSVGRIVLHIRHGIHFGLNPDSAASKLVNGRELTGDDVAYTINRMLTLQGSYWKTAAPTFSASAKVSQPDKWTVEVNCDPADAYNYAAYLVDWCSIQAKEVVDKYGDLRDWRNSVGSGPFFLTDFVSNSSISYVKNPNYWRQDPVGPGKGNQLPYVDKIKVLIIPDASTRESAMRTGKLDIYGGNTWDDANNIRKTVKNLNEVSYVIQNPSQLFMRTDKQDLPYKDIRVRQALMYATDYDSIIKDFMAGHAYAQSFPITPMPDFKSVYVPLDQCSPAVQDLYKYNPDKAKKSLSDAGYPNGFKCSVMYNNTGTAAVDYLSIVKGMWAKVGVDLTLVPVENAAFNTRWNARNYDDMLFGLMASAGTYRRGTNFAGAGGGWNLSYITDPKAAEARDKMLTLFNSGDDAGCDAVMREFTKYLLEQAWVIPNPVQEYVTFWQPWVKNYHGESSPGIINEGQQNMYIWVDQDLKTQLGY
jgi:peptide/nickel transport system substrate-binding protein